jgi:hypothetical protein
MVVELQTAHMPIDAPYLIVPRRVKDIDCLLVIIRVRKATVTYLGVFMPNSTHPIDHFCKVMADHKDENDGKTITIANKDISI